MKFKRLPPFSAAIVIIIIAVIFSYTSSVNNDIDSDVVTLQNILDSAECPQNEWTPVGRNTYDCGDAETYTSVTEIFNSHPLVKGNNFILYAVNYGGTGSFISGAYIENGEYLTFDIGDRILIDVSSVVAAADGQAGFSVTYHGENDPSCCPTKKGILTIDISTDDEIKYMIR